MSDGFGPADLALFGGVIHALSAEVPRPEVVIVRGGRVVATGGRELLDVHRPRQTLDLQGACVIPGLIDAHAHFIGLGRWRSQVDLRDAASFEDVIDLVRAAASLAAPGAFVLGRGWNQELWQDTSMPTHDALSAATPDHPVLLRRVDGHATLANAAAMRLAPSMESPSGGEILRDSAGHPTGVFIDAACDLLPKPPEATDDELAGMALAAQDACLAVGLTGVHDAGVDERSLRVLERLAESGALRVRVNVMLDADFSADGAPKEWLARRLAEGPREGLRSMKVYLDGALGSRGAALLEPYSDRPSSRGLLLLDRAKLRARAVACRDAGFQLCVHAIGDAANREVLDVMEEVGVRSDWRWRIEHAQVIAPADVPRFAKLGVIASVQPTHATSDMRMAEERLGEARLCGAYAWQSLRRSGARLALGSDFPIEDENPLWGLFAASTRTDRDGHPAGGWRTEEALTREQALRGFTLDAAHASFSEEQVGSLEHGRQADFVVLPKDPLTCEARDLVTMRPLSTWISGRQEWPR